MYLSKVARTIFHNALPGKLKLARLISVIAIMIALFIAAFQVPIARRFVIIHEKTGKILYCAPIKRGDTFTVTYTHSVNKSPVDDIFEIQQDYSIMLKKTVFRAFGVGIPSEAENGQTIKVYEDRTEIDNINTPIKKYLLFVGLIADHRVTVNGQQLHLNKLIEPQQTVEFEVRKVPAYILLRRN